MIDTPTDHVDPADHGIAPVLSRRWSPRTFDRSDLADAELLRLLEAARWAPSSANEQPWRFLLAPRGDAVAFADALACLKDSNRAWAAGASLLIFTFAKRTYSRSGGANRFSWHDLGQAVAHLTVQATTMGLHVHQMGGIRHDAVVENYGVPDDYQVVSAVAVGRLGDERELSEVQRERERRPRVRRPLAETVFATTFGRPAPQVAGAEQRPGSGSEGVADRHQQP